MILTSNRGFSEWADIFGDAVVATALLDRLLHHAVVIAIEGNSYRLREHADLVPEHLRSRPIPKIDRSARTQGRRGRHQRSPPDPVSADHRSAKGWGNLLRQFGEILGDIDTDD